MPQSYILASKRCFNHFIEDTYSLYRTRPDVMIYVDNGELIDKDLPAGIEEGVRNFKMQILNSHTFKLTDDKNRADYTLTTSAQWFDTPTKDIPAIKYTINLINNHGQVFKSWSEVVKKTNEGWL